VVLKSLEPPFFLYFTANSKGVRRETRIPHSLSSSLDCDFLDRRCWSSAERRQKLWN